ncbi:putative FBD-associated F-box protein [Cardamine amara subsp. amara]|uniref:FBD-associated F-box protein n=1 Tax=Cardamine amara subsp. amara TaxID=228776 RepID=A0ABD0ZKN6_CARAN
MDRISNLSDDLLLKILSTFPTKDVVATTLLSKRWKFLWTMVHKLDFDDNWECYYLDQDYNKHDVNSDPSKYGSFVQFVDRVMVLHKAPVLETLKFKVGHWCNSEDMAHWIRIGIVRHFRELEISHSVGYNGYRHQSILLPRSLYMYAKLEVLKLTNMIDLDVPTDVCLPSLKSLHLLRVEYKTDECHRKLLSGCPVLEELVVDKSENSYMKNFYVVMSSLERLSILDTWGYEKDGFVPKVVINAPSLKYLKIIDLTGNHLYCLSENMPDLAEANVNIIHESLEMLMGSLTSVKRLSLCLAVSASMLERRIVFNQLVHLELCGCGPKWWDLLTWMLQSSPKLHVLKLENCKERSRCSVNPIEGHWGQPNSVPECLRLHLNTFKWKRYDGRREEKKLVAYILNNARCLNTATFSLLTFEDKKKKVARELKELVSMSSSSCQLLIDEF